MGLVLVSVQRASGQKEASQPAERPVVLQAALQQAAVSQLTVPVLWESLLTAPEPTVSSVRASGQPVLSVPVPEKVAE